MLDRRTYNLSSGEWRKVADEYVRLEAEAMRQYMTLEPQYRDAYKQLILFPVQAMSNIYEMYYAQAMNLKLFEEMKEGKYKDGEKVLRAKIDMASPQYEHARSGHLPCGTYGASQYKG